MAKPPPTEWHDEKEHRRFLAEVEIGTLQGKTNAAGSLTLATGTSVTTTTDQRVGVDSVITFMPKDANAAAELSVLFVSSRGKETFDVTHSSTSTSRTYEYHLGGTGRGS